MKKRLLIALFAAFALWAAVTVTDLVRVKSFHKPMFCILTESADDGGSGRYAGLGYSFDIRGNFMPEDELPGVTEWTCYLFGKEIKTGIRD